jgi:hypothetical protein
MQTLDLFCIDRGCAFAAAFEDVRCAIQQQPFLMMNPAHQVGYRRLAFQRLQHHLRVKLDGMLFAFRHL